jgi:hypothetical protein
MDSKRSLYTAERLADVLALIQVLALDPHTHRSEENLKGELQGLPRTGDSWTKIASDHPEFFRVKKESSTAPVSLVARHVIPKDPVTDSRPMPPEMTYRLLQSAIDLYDRAASESRRWDQLKSVMAGGMIGLIPGLIALWITLHATAVHCK